MLIVINIIGIAVFLGIAILLSKDRQSINKKSVVRLLALNIFIGWFLISFPIGREFIVVAAATFTSNVVKAAPVKYDSKLGKCTADEFHNRRAYAVAHDRSILRHS